MLEEVIRRLTPLQICTLTECLRLNTAAANGSLQSFMAEDTLEMVSMIESSALGIHGVMVRQTKVIRKAERIARQLVK